MHFSEGQVDDDDDPEDTVVENHNPLSNKQFI